MKEVLCVHHVPVMLCPILYRAVCASFVTSSHLKSFLSVIDKCTLLDEVESAIIPPLENGSSERRPNFTIIEAFRWGAVQSIRQIAGVRRMRVRRACWCCVLSECILSVGTMFMSYFSFFFSLMTEISKLRDERSEGMEEMRVSHSRRRYHGFAVVTSAAGALACLIVSGCETEDRKIIHDV